MKFFMVHYVHFDIPKWKEYAHAHTDWLKSVVASGKLRASGPLTDASVRSAMLIFAVDSKDELVETMSGDPYHFHGLISEMQILEWMPFFGVFSAEVQGDPSQILASVK